MQRVRLRTPLAGGCGDLVRLRLGRRLACRALFSVVPGDRCRFEAPSTYGAISNSVAVVAELRPAPDC